MDWPEITALKEDVELEWEPGQYLRAKAIVMPM